MYMSGVRTSLPQPLDMGNERLRGQLKPPGEGKSSSYQEKGESPKAQKDLACVSYGKEASTVQGLVAFIWLMSAASICSSS